MARILSKLPKAQIFELEGEIWVSGAIQLVINEMPITDQDSIFEACKRNHITRFKKFFDTVYEASDLEDVLYYALYYACFYGYRDLAEFIIKKGAHCWDNGLAGACTGGNRELVELMILKGATNLHWGLYRACQYGHRELVEFLIDHGANNWNLGLCGAYDGGFHDLLDLMISHGADMWRWGLQHKICMCHYHRIYPNI